MIYRIGRTGRVGTIIVVCWGLAVGGAKAASEIPPDQWIPGQEAKSDKGAFGVDIPDTSDVGDLLFGLKKPLTLQPGVYRIRAMVRPEPVMNMAYRIVLTVRSDKPTRQYKRWRPPASLLTIRPKEIWHALDEARAVEHDDQGLVHLEAELAVTQAHAYQIAVGWKMGETQIGSVLKWSEAPASLDRLTLVSLTYEKLPRRVSLGMLKANRLVYKPGMVPTLSVPIAWTGDKPKTFGYQVRQSHDLESAEVVARGTVTLKPHAATPLEVPLSALTVFGGYRFDLDLLDGDRVVQSGERSASCSARYNRVAVSGSAGDEYFMGSVHMNPQRSEQVFQNMRDGYVSWMEIGFWASDDFSSLTSDKEGYISNVMSQQYTSRIRNTCQAGRKYGVGVNFYAKAISPDGRDGFAWAQRYPDLVLYHRDTGRPMAKYNMDHILNWDTYEKDILARKRRINAWHRVSVDTGRPSIVDVEVAQTLATVRQFGWAGVRFDGDFSVPVSDLALEGPVRNLKGKITATAEDAEVTYANNVLRYKRKVRRALPDFEFGFNHSFDDSTQRWIVGPAIASDGSMVMNEPIRGFGNSKERAYNRWDDFARLMIHYSRIVRSWGGFYMPIGCYGMRADDYLYESVYVLAAKAKSYGPFFYNTKFTRPMARFMTRFAGVLCADAYPVPAPEGRITLEGSGPLQWKRYVNFVEPDDKRRDYVIQMINPPVPERAKSKDVRCLLRPPVTDVRVSFDTDPFEVPVKAWLLDPWNPDDMTPVTFQRRPDGLDLVLPDAVRVWSVLVIRCELKEAK